MMVGPNNSSLKMTIFNELHCSPTAGHSGFHKTSRRVSNSFYWPSWRRDVKRWVQECDICQRIKNENVPLPGLLHPLPIPDEVWRHISIDFIDGLPISSNKSVIFVVVDRLSKYAHFLPLSHPYTAQSVAKLFFDNIFKLHGMPATIVSDRDPLFTSTFWREIFKLQGTQLRMTSSYHPQSDGQTEVVNRCLENYLRCYIGDHPKSWVRWIPLAEWWYNTTFHSATKVTPYQAVYGVAPATLLSYVSGTTRVAAVDDELRDSEKALILLKDNLRKAQARMKQNADKHRTEREFAVGDWVYLRLQPYRQSTISARRSQKLAARYFGPFQVLEKTGTVAYRLNLPAESKLHPVFHISKLKKKIGQDVIPQPSLPPLHSDGSLNPYPSAILARRIVKRGSAISVEVLVSWLGAPNSDATREKYRDLESRFPQFILEDKKRLRGGN